MKPLRILIKEWQKQNISYAKELFQTTAEEVEAEERVVIEDDVLSPGRLKK